MVGAMMVRVDRALEDLAVMVGAMTAQVAAALRVADLVDREIVVPMAPVVSGADRTVLLVADRERAARMVVLVDVDPAVPMVLAAADRIVVPALVAKVDLMVAVPAVPMVLAAEVAGVVLALVVPEEVRAEGASSSEWIKSTASSMKSFDRLSP